MSTHNIGFYEDLTKIIFQLSIHTLSLLLNKDVDQPAQSHNQMCISIVR